MNKQLQQYGTWRSPISPRGIAGSLRFNDVQWDNASDTLVWSESRGAQGVLMAHSGYDAPRDLTGDEMSVRGRVGYGGGEFTVANGIVYFAGNGGRLYRLPLSGGAARAITPGFGYAAAPCVSPDGKWVVYVYTYEHQDGLALVDAEGILWPRKLASATDFVMQPVWHPEGTHLAYIAWNHPQMPWDGTELCLAALKTDQSGVPFVESVDIIAGNTETAVFQPEFSPDGRYLAYVSDQTGYGQIHLYDLKAKTHQPITDGEAEHGRPAWVQGVRVYGWADPKRLYFLRNEKGIHSLWQAHISKQETKRIRALDDYTDMDQLAISPRFEAVAVIASAARIPPRIVSYVPGDAEFPREIWAGVPGVERPSMDVIIEEDTPVPGLRIHRRAALENIPQTQLSEVHPVEWAGHDGETVYGLYYGPASERFEGAGAPPLIVMVHGGPTSQVTAGYSGETQFYATRGFAVLHVNYRGSTGYGRAYMNKLRGNWGIYDVEDSVTGANYLAERGLADLARVVILGGSAGGFTVLQALVAKPGFFKAGVCKYGISNQFMLVQDTHKFEERYSDSLLGPLPEAAAIYRERSPLFHAEKIVDPVIIFQGADDVVVPKNQSDMIVEKLRARGVPHEYHVYEGEGHGFRRPENLEHYYTSVMKFLTQYVIYS